MQSPREAPLGASVAQSTPYIQRYNIYVHFLISYQSDQRLLGIIFSMIRHGTNQFANPATIALFHIHYERFSHWNSPVFPLLPVQGFIAPYFIKLGKINEICGKAVNKIRLITWHRRNGREPIAMSVVLTWGMTLLVAKRVRPKGGVIIPISHS